MNPPLAQGGMVRVWSNSRQMQLPAEVAIQPGSTSARFTVVAPLIDRDEVETINASVGSASARAMLRLSGVRPSSLSCLPKSVAAGAQVRCEVTINSAEVRMPVNLILRATAGLRVPQAISIRPGQSSTAFVAVAEMLRQQQTSSVSAAFQSNSIQESLTILPSNRPLLEAPGFLRVTAGETLTFSVSASDPGGAAISVTAVELPADAQFTTQTGQFTWTPADSDGGLHRVRFRAQTPSLVESTKDVVIEVVSSRPLVRRVVNSARYTEEGACSPGSLATVFGGGFREGDPTVASEANLREVGGVQVLVNGTAAPLFFVSSSQINFQCPMLAPGTPLAISVRGRGTESNRLENLRMEFGAPAVFSMDGSGANQGAVQLAGTTLLAMVPEGPFTGQPAQIGDYIVVYTTGLGEIDLDLPDGMPAPADRLARVKAPVRLFLGDVEADVTFAGLAPGFMGLYQINAQIRPGTPTGDRVPLRVQLSDTASGTVLDSNQVTIAVEAPRR